MKRRPPLHNPCLKSPKADKDAHWRHLLCEKPEWHQWLSGRYALEAERRRRLEDRRKDPNYDKLKHRPRGCVINHSGKREVRPSLSWRR